MDLEPGDHSCQALLRFLHMVVMGKAPNVPFINFLSEESNVDIL